jgi:hypothetical protein
MKKNIALAALLIALPMTALWAQTTAGFGAISGVVTDATGSVVPSAKVAVDNTSRGIHRELQTSGSGVFTVPALVPSDGYSVTISKEGFANYELKDINVAVGQVVALNPSLAVAGSATQVSVTSEAPVVEAEKTDLSQVVGSKQILDLPINGRRVDNFVLLTPGVTADGPFGLLSFRGNPGGNAFLTDGVDTTNAFYDENAGRSRTTNISQDAVQEFQVVSSNFLAEYGKASGGVVNTVTRSGSNNLTGTLYWFFRNRTLNATDITANGINPPEWRHQAGASVGGPIKRDKLFYFFNGELTRRNEPLVSSNLLTAISSTGPFDSNLNLKPTACVAANTVLPGSATAVSRTPTAAQCAAAADYIRSRIKPQLLPRTYDINLLFGKIDYRPNDKNAFAFAMNYMDFRSPNGIQTQLSLTTGAGIGGNADTNVFDRNAKAEWTYVASPNAVNLLRYGMFKDRQYDPASPSLLPSYGPSDLSVTGTGSNLGYAAGYPRLNPSELRHQISDSFSWNIGPHAVKFGGDFAHTEDYVNRLSPLFGTYSFPSFAAFALDYSGNTAGAKSYSSFTQAFGNPIVDVKSKEFSAFVQDQWHVTPKLLVTPGLRYDVFFLPQPATTNPLWPQTGIIPQTRLNFGPRFGVAYTLDSKTVVRAGYGLFYNRYPTSTIENAILSNGLYQSSYAINNSASIASAGPAFPAYLSSKPNVSGSPSLLLLDPTFRNAYSQQATLAVEREVAKNTSLTVSYVWSLGLHLLQTRDINAAAATQTYTYPILDASNNIVGNYTTPIYTQRINPNYGTVAQIESAGKAYYDAMVVQLTRRFSGWFYGNAAYTWSHAIDNNQGGGNNTLFGSSFATTAVVNGDYNAEKGNSSSDQRQRLVVNGVIAPTFNHKTDWASRYLVNGWQLSFVTTAGTSFGISPTISVSSRPVVGATTISTLSSSTINGLGGSFRVPFEDPSFLKLGNIYKTDMRLQKQLAITEKVKLNLFFEAFNVFNHVIVQGLSARQPQQYQARVLGSGASAVTALFPTNTYGTIAATSESLNGTTARRAQVGVRILF